MLLKTTPFLFSSFLPPWQVFISCKAGRLGTCQGYLIPPGVQILLCPFLPCPVEPLCRCQSFTVSFLASCCSLPSSCLSLALLLPGIGENHTPSLFSTMSFLKVVLFSGLPGVGRNSTDLKCHVPCNWISLSFLLLPTSHYSHFPKKVTLRPHHS